jgi:hypothetical protein
MTPMRRRPSLASAATLLLLAACAGTPTPTDDPAPPEATARAALDSLLADGRRAHLETDAGRLAAGLADSLVSLDAGAVSVQLAGQDVGLTVTVRDAAGLPLPDVPVTWGSSGTGTVSRTTVMTDSYGRVHGMAASTAPGTQTITAAAGGVTASPESLC